MMSIIISFIISLCISGFAWQAVPFAPDSMKSVVLACESGKSEHILHVIDPKSPNDEFLTGIGAVSGTALNALYQDAAPVIMTSGVYENIYFHSLIFSDCLKLSYEALHQKYGCYAKFKQKSSLSQFADDCRYAYELYSSFNRLTMSPYGRSNQLLKDRILGEPVFDRQNASLSFKINNQAAIDDVLMFLQAYVVYTNCHSYCYKDARYQEDNLYVCIPHAYAIKQNLPYLHEIDHTHPLAVKWQDSLGISLKKLSHVEHIPLENMRKISEDTTYRQAFIDGIKHLLVAENNLWSIFMIGHGIFDQTDYVDDVTQKKINYSTVGGLSVEQFRELISYWNDHMSIHVFFYKSCSAGGLNFVNTFTDPISKKPLIYKYTIITDTLCEAPTTAFIGLLPVAGFRNGMMQYGFNPFYYVDRESSKMNLLGTCDYKRFFTLLNETRHDSVVWQKSLASVSGWIGNYGVVIDETTGLFKKKFCADIISIRFPGQDLFMILDDKDRCRIIDSKHTQIIQPYEALLLYQPNIAGITITLPKDVDLPACISMLPGAAEHEIGFLHAAQHTLTEVIKSFFTLEQLRATKMITIKEVVCVNDMPITKVPLSKQATFTDVLFLNNVTSNGKQVNTILFTYNGDHFHYSYDAMCLMPKDIRHKCKKIENVASYTNLIKSYKNYFKEFALIKPVHTEKLINFDEFAALVKA